MTLDEAIKHAEEVAEEQNKAAKEWHENQKWCENCAKEHKQLAEWLKELKTYREFADWLAKVVLEEDWGKKCCFLCRSHMSETNKVRQTKSYR